MIHLNNFTKLWKTKKALEQVEDIQLRERILKYYRPKTHKPKKSVTWKDIADRVFSEYIRLKNSNDKWVCECFTCWRKQNRKEIQNGHFISRWNMKYRYSEINCNPQCQMCNVILNWNYIQYTLKMIEKIGKTDTEKIINDKQTIELKQYQYEEMIIQRYEFICDKKQKIWEKDM